MRKAEERQAIIDDARDQLESTNGPIEDLKAELEEIRDNLEEKFSGTERYAAIEAAIASLDGIIDGISTATSAMDDISFEW